MGDAALRGTGPHRFDVFLSHNSVDKPTVERLAEKLREIGLKPWLDRWYLTGGAVWQEDLAAALRASGTCAVFVGPHGLGDWTREELLVAQDRATKGGGFRLIPVLLPGLPDPFDPSSVLPPFLGSRMWVDLRAGIDDPAGFQCLVSAITGVPVGPVGLVEPQDQTPPYRGLRPFEEEHAAFFFGRDADVQRLLEKLKASRFLAVLGPSGSGKSSLVRAGLVPALRRGEPPGSSTWPIHLLTPGARPLEALAVCLVELGGSPDPVGVARQLRAHLQEDHQALHLAIRLAAHGSSDGARTALVVDQFEEAFTLCRDEAERAQFLANLLYAATVPDGRCLVILTLRADFYSRCAAYSELASQVATHQYLVGPMSLDSLRQVIEEPAHRVGLDFEVGLVDAIVEDVAEQPGALPLLQHTLWELWQRRRGRLLTLERYRDTGGVAGALAKRADEVYCGLRPEEQAITRRVLLRLTEPGEDTEDTRRRADLSELVRGADERPTVEAVVRVLTDARLLTTSRDQRTSQQTIDVAHEALIRGWPRLRAWIDEDRAGLRVLRRLTEAAQEWERSSCDESLLYRGARLAEVTDWRARNEAQLNDLERRFLDASRHAAQRRHRLTVGVVTTILLVVSALAVTASWQWRQAEQQRVRAEQRFDDVWQLAHFFMFDFYDSIENLPGSTHARQLIVDQALKYLNKLAQDPGSDPRLQRDIAIAYTRVGDVQGDPLRSNAGDVARALESDRQALAIFERLAQADPTNTAAQRDLSLTQSRVADMQAATGDAAGARDGYRRALAGFERLAQADATDAEAERDLSVVQDRLGDLQAATGDAAGALESYRQVLAVAERLAQADPTNAMAQRDLSVARARLSDMQAATGDAAGALDSARGALAGFERLAQADPTNAPAQRDLSVAQGGLGDLQAATGDAAGALDSYRQALAGFEQLAQADPANALAQRDLSLDQERIGDMQALTGDTAGALDRYRQALAGFEQLAHDPTNAQAEGDLEGIRRKISELQVGG